LFFHYFYILILLKMKNTQKELGFSQKPGKLGFLKKPEWIASILVVA